ncbi:MAG TPA: nicotinate-nucleotide adenylyltransferase [Gemmatimonadaceae bacterium]|nr:nicotinate-nucleotide adenylyltransferase [Gemmatimonadaceae bacterium]
MRIGLMGGTFDPPHTGHLLAASDALDHLSLDRLVFIPAAQQPLKQHQLAAPATHRLRMVQTMAEGDPHLEVDEIEVARSGLSFSVDTLAEYARRFPDAERFFLLGVDAFALLDQWRDAARVVSLAHFVVMTRASGPGASHAMDLDAVLSMVRAIGGAQAASPEVMNLRRIDVSSTEIRERVRTGRSIRGFVTDGVAQYIETNGLYR